MRSSRVITSAAAACVLLVASTARASIVTVDCSGATPGAFTSITTALATLTVGGPHTINVSGTCSENVVFTGRTDLVIQGTGGAVLQAASTALPAFSARRSRGIQVLDLTLVGGFRFEDTQGLFRGRVENGPSNGMVVGGVSTLQILPPAVVSGNALAGIVVEQGSSLTTNGSLTVEDNEGIGISASGIVRLFTSSGDNVIRRNGAGIDLSQGGKLAINGGTSVLDNGAFGVQVALGASAVFSGAPSPSGTKGVVVEGNGAYGLAIAAGAAANLSGPHRIARNGALSDEAGGVRVGSTSRVQFNAGVQIVDNIGPGLLAEWNAAVFFFDTTIDGNTQEGLRVIRGSVAKVEAGTVFGANGGGTLTCDTTALVVASGPGLDGVHPNRCARIERENGKPRPGVVK